MRSWRSLLRDEPDRRVRAHPAEVKPQTPGEKDFYENMPKTAMAGERGFCR